MNALNYEEAVPKLLKVQLNEGEEFRYFLVFCVAYRAFQIELVNVVIECCSQDHFIIDFLWPRHQTFLQVQSCVERVL